MQAGPDGGQRAEDGDVAVAPGEDSLTMPLQHLPTAG